MGKEFRGNRGGGRGGFSRGGRGGDRGRPKQNWDEPPEEITETGIVMHAVPEKLILVKSILKDKVPIFGRPVYLEDKKKIGIIDDVLGPINEYMFSVVCDDNIKNESLKPDTKIYMNTFHFLPMSRFLPKKPGEKTQGKPNAQKGRGGRGGANMRGRGGRGGNFRGNNNSFRGNNNFRGRGNFRGNNQRGFNK